PDFDWSTYDAEADTADWRRCWRRWGCRGWRGRGRRGVDAGDVLAGVLVIGGIAAIASAASNNRRERERDVVVIERDRVRYDDRYDDRRRDDRRYEDRYDDRRYGKRRSSPRRSPAPRSGASGLDNAVDMCLTEIERDVRVEEVDNVRRTARGWSVAGSLFSGSSFLCTIGDDGRIEAIDYGGYTGRASAGPARDGDSIRPAGENPSARPVGESGLVRTVAENAEQWSDARYLRARAAVERREGFGPQPDAEMRVALVTTPGDVEAAFAGRRAATRSAARPASRRASEPLVPLGAERQPAYPGGPIPGAENPRTRPIDGDLRR
ncbi:MAG: hypothetical protein GVX90_00105, partial [Alphaproteobacteria bacterium]|nr:hypothetical protein [Alphaproteobacteria bacterium]